MVTCSDTTRGAAGGATVRDSTPGHASQLIFGQGVTTGTAEVIFAAIQGRLEQAIARRSCGALRFTDCLFDALKGFQ
jgi:hypothetical protein